MLSASLLAGGIHGGALQFGSSALAQSDDPALIKALAERALGEGPGGTVQLAPGRIADDLPGDIMPTGWRLIGSVTRQNPSNPGSPPYRWSQTFFDAPGLPTDTQDALVAALATKAGTRVRFLSSLAAGSSQVRSRSRQ